MRWGRLVGLSFKTRELDLTGLGGVRVATRGRLRLVCTRGISTEDVCGGCARVSGSVGSRGETPGSPRVVRVLTPCPGPSTTRMFGSLSPYPSVGPSLPPPPPSVSHPRPLHRVSSVGEGTPGVYGLHSLPPRRTTTRVRRGGVRTSHGRVTRDPPPVPRSLERSGDRFGVGL